MEKYVVVYGKKTIEFELQRKNVKNINLNVRPDMSVIVTAGEEIPEKYIMDFVKSKASWILKNKNYFIDTQSESIIKKEYVSGETFKYLGRQYRLKVEEDEGKEGVKYYQGFIQLNVRDKKNYIRKENLITRWFRGKANVNFRESLDRVFPVVEKYGIKKPKIQIRSMKARWGSCLKNKNILLLNFELIKAPKYCIDYVILHELIHFKNSSHNTEFYEFLTTLMPDWKQRKEILDEEVVREL